MPQNLLVDKKAKNFIPNDEEKNIIKYLSQRIEVLKKTKLAIPPNNRNFEEVMREADTEYEPRALREQKPKRSIFVENELLGLRGSRVVPIGSTTDEDWRSDVAEPTLLVKVQTALSILVDHNPEAVLKAGLDRYKKATELFKALRKRNWELTYAKDQLKLFIFDLAKYGWAIGRTYPRLIKRDAEILEELDLERPERNKYKKIEVVEFNDIFREKLDPYRTWIDDKTNLTDPFSQDDWYYEKDYSYDEAEEEFGDYENWASIPAEGMKLDQPITNGQENVETQTRKDIITIGFYESKRKDLYVIYAPQKQIPIYYSPLPSDKKKLSCWWTYWNIRDPRTPYGIGLYEIIKNNQVLYDRMKNMTVDQLVMAIYPLLFYSGPTQGGASGTMKISPGVLQQKLPGTTIEQVNVKYDPRGWEAVQMIKEAIDETTGLTPTLEGEVESKTLGQSLLSKEASLRRLSTPLGNIASVLEKEAYLTICWIQQVYSVPEIKEFSNEQDVQAYMQEQGIDYANLLEQENGSINASFYRTVELALTEDEEGNLIESPKDRFFQIGRDLETKNLNWDGTITIKAMSIVQPNLELEKQRKLELFNLVVPVIQSMTTMPQAVPYLIKPLKQVLEAQEEKPENWLPAELLEMGEMPMNPMNPMMPPQGNLFTSQGGGMMPASPETASPATPPVAPRSQVTNPTRSMLGRVTDSFRNFMGGK